MNNGRGILQRHWKHLTKASTRAWGQQREQLVFSRQLWECVWMVDHQEAKPMNSSSYYRMQKRRSSLDGLYSLRSEASHQRIPAIVKQIAEGIRKRRVKGINEDNGPLGANWTTMGYSILETSSVLDDNASYETQAVRKWSDSRRVAKVTLALNQNIFMSDIESGLSWSWKSRAGLLQSIYLQFVDKAFFQTQFSRLFSYLRAFCIEMTIRTRFLPSGTRCHISFKRFHWASSINSVEYFIIWTVEITKKPWCAISGS